MQPPTDAAPPLVSLYRSPGITPADHRRRDEEDARTGLIGQPGTMANGFAQALNETRASGAPATGIGEAVLDTLNPLHHVPGVSTAYRAVTGDEIEAPARLMGGALFGSLLFGGPVGLGFALANVISEGMTGRDIGENALALVGVETPARPQATTQTAAAEKARANENAGETPDDADAGQGPLDHLRRHLDVKRWAEEEARLRQHEAQARATPPSKHDDASKTADAALASVLRAGVVQAEALDAAKQYGHAGRLAGDTMSAAFDMES